MGEAEKLCLTRDHLTELCRTPRKAGQVEFLVRNGIRHYLDAHGWPVVTRAAVEGQQDQAQPKQVWRSNKAA